MNKTEPLNWGPGEGHVYHPHRPPLDDPHLVLLRNRGKWREAEPPPSATRLFQPMRRGHVARRTPEERAAAASNEAGRRLVAEALG